MTSSVDWEQLLQFKASNWKLLNAVSNAGVKAAREFNEMSLTRADDVSNYDCPG